MYRSPRFGTEVVTSADKTLVGLLGASPGASVSPHIAMEVLSNFHMAGNRGNTQEAKDTLKVNA